MSFELRPGDRMVRYYHPEPEGLAYLPYKFTGRDWEEFPQEVAEYAIRTADGPRCQKDARRWATGILEQVMPAAGDGTTTFAVNSPYVIIDAQFEFNVALEAGQTLVAETSIDDGGSWDRAGELRGPRAGAWKIEPAVLTRSAHGSRTAVAGSHRYLVRLTKVGGAEWRDGVLRTRIQLNPRTLPELAPGRNELIYTSGPAVSRRSVPARPVAVDRARFVSDGAQGYWAPNDGATGDLLFHIAGPLDAFSAGGRFLDLSRGVAPDKFTAEVRKVAPLLSANATASIEWSTPRQGPFQTLWTYDPGLKWKDGVVIDRTLRWPEVDRRIETKGASDIYVRYRIAGLGADSIRLSAETSGKGEPRPLEVTHSWTEDGKSKSRLERIPPGTTEHRYVIEIPAGAAVKNEALSFECK